MTVTIGVSCVGSGIGQSVVDALRLSRDSFRIIGFDTNPLAYGGLFCDNFYSMLPNRDPGYLKKLLDICCNEKIVALIPGLDSELILLSKAESLFKEHNITVLVSSESVIELCHNKMKLSQDLNSLFPEVVASYSREEAEKAIEKGEIHFPMISKPVSGSGSRGICIIRDPDELKSISEDKIIQPFIFPDESDPNSLLIHQEMEKGKVAQLSEISVQYLISKKRKVLGRMATQNRLKSGVPVEITPIDRPLIWETTDKIIAHLITLGSWGPINFQGRLFSKGFHIFEINARFTGITGLRAKMGFNEVEASVLDCLNAPKDRIDSALGYQPRHLGVRQVNDAKISIRTKPYVANHAKSKKVCFKEFYRKVVLVTGATGYIGQNLVRKLIRSPEIERVIAVARNKQKAKSAFGSIQDDNLTFLLIEEAPVENWNLGQVDTIVHLGNARPPGGAKAIAESLELTKNLVTQAGAYHVPEFVYVSSQAVYGYKESSLLWKEDSPLSPDSPYAVAKLAGEMLVQGLKNLIPQSTIWILRLSRVYGKGFGMRWQEMPHKFVADFWQKKAISISGGMQIFDLLHIRDAISGILCVLKAQHNHNTLIYNLGSGQPVGITELADCVNLAALEIGLARVPILIMSGDNERKFGMDTTLFCRDFDWKHNISKQDGILELVRMIAKKPEDKNLMSN